MKRAALLVAVAALCAPPRRPARAQAGTRPLSPGISGYQQVKFDAAPQLPHPALRPGPPGAASPGRRAFGGPLATLAAAAGHAGRPGPVILPLPLRCNGRGALEMGALPDALPGPCALDDPSAVRRLAGVWCSMW